MKTGVLKWGWCLGLVAGLCSCAIEDRQEVRSPDKHVLVELTGLDKEHYGDAALSVFYDGTRALPLVDLGIETNLQKYAGNLKFKSVTEAKPVEDDYLMPTGKRSHCVNHGTEKVYSFENEEGNILDVTVRAYNDGVAFKYRRKSMWWTNIRHTMCLRARNVGCNNTLWGMKVFILCPRMAGARMVRLTNGGIPVWCN